MCAAGHGDGGGGQQVRPREGFGATHPGISRETPGEEEEEEEQRWSLLATHLAVEMSAP